jgi:predicted dehydrogenase
MKFVIAGAGSIGRRHLRNLVSLGEKDILLYRTHKSTMPEEELAGFETVTDFQQALAAKPDAVIVSNPTAMHLDIAIPAARAGIHVFMEKPISHSMERVDELQNLVIQQKIHAMVGFQFRFHPTLQRLKELLLEGVIGTPVSCRAHWGEYLPNWHPWEDFRNSYAARPDLGGGVVLTLSHPFDYLRWILGEIDSLWAYTSTSAELPIGTESNAEIGLQFANGVTGSVHLDYIQQPGSHTLEINGTQGSIRWDNTKGELRLYQATHREWTSFLPPEGFERNDLFVAEMAAFLKVLRGEITSPCTLEDGIKALDIALGVHQSALEKRMVSLRK